MKINGLIIGFVFSLLTVNSFAENNLTQYSKFSEIIRENWQENYLEEIKFNIDNDVIIINGKEKVIDAKPCIVEGRTMLPARIIAEELNAKIDFDSNSQKINFEIDDIDIAVTVGNNEMEVNGEKILMEVSPVIQNGRTLLPVRAITESFGMGLKWNEEKKQITLTNDLQMKRIIVKASSELDFSVYQPIDIVDMGNHLYILQFDSIGKTQKAYNEIQKLNEVTYVELDKLIKVNNIENKEQVENNYLSWGASKMHVKEYVDFLKQNKKFEEVVVAVIDTGIDLNHSLFQGRIKEGGYNIAEGNNNLVDIDGHGTHVAGIIADLTKGLNVKILPINMSTKDGKSSISIIINAINYARTKNVDIINLSLDFTTGGQAWKDAVYGAIEKDGIIIINASGNESMSIDEFAKDKSKVIYVGAVDERGERYSFSNYGSELDIVAPGINIRSTVINGYDNMSGTSMATPHISAVMALYKVNNKNMTPEQAELILKKNIDDLGNTGKDIYFGEGIPNLLKAIPEKNQVPSYEIPSKSERPDVQLPSNQTCSVCNSKTYWEQTETMHVLVCEADKTHVILIEGHNIANDGECIVCKYKETETTGCSFVDIPKDHWAYKNVAYMEKQDIARGGINTNGERIISPEEIIKAEEFIALMARVAGYRDLDEISDNSVYNPFGKEIENNWTRGHWKYLLNYLEKEVGRNSRLEMMTLLAANGINGSDAEIVENYKKPITRERAAYLLGALMSDQIINKTIGKGLADDFADWGEISNTDYKNRLEMLSAYDILRGIPNYTNNKVYIDPKGQLTRAQAIALIDRYNSIRNLTYKY